MEYPAGLVRATRRSVSVDEIKGMLELRVYGPEACAHEVTEQATQASRLRLAAVICRPEHVPAAAHAVAGTEVEVCTGLDFHAPRAPLAHPRALAHETVRLVDAGATSVALTVTQQRLEIDGGRALARALGAVTAAARSHAATSRAIIDPISRDCSQALAAARLCADAGVSLIQAGSWEGPRASFDSLHAFRGVLSPDIQLKWTTPVRTIDLLLLTIAEGANRFNGDVHALIQEAENRAPWLPMVVPDRGWDY
jgi:deoxyribose-phosphate aldolase